MIRCWHLVNDGRIMPNSREIISSSSGDDSAGQSLLGRLRLSDLLGRRQWLVLFGFGAIVTIIEIRNHTAMWEEHQSGQTIWTDHELIIEVFLFGLILPILAGIVFGYMARTASERDQIAKELQLHRGLVTRMNNAKSHQELAEIIVTVPGNTAHADRAWLLAQNAGDEEFEQIAHWERPGSDPKLSYLPVIPAVCEHCERVNSIKGTRIVPCQHSDFGDNNLQINRYCLWLTSASTGKATLLFETPSEYRLNIHELKVLDNLGDEISLAVENANLLNLKQRQVNAARDERLRIARNLHDTVGQNVSYLRLKLDRLRTSALTSEPVVFQHELADSVTVADEIYEQMRDTLEELRTTEHQDLDQAIHHYTTTVAAQSGFSVSVQTKGIIKLLSSRRNRQVMYIVREALNNVEKHASATKVDVLLYYAEDVFILTIRDDGTGFQPETVDTTDRYGLVIMGERAHAINGSLAIQSSPGKGTEITLRIPLASSAVTSERDQ